MGVYTNISAVNMDSAIETESCGEELADLIIEKQGGEFLHVDEILIDDAVEETHDEYGGWLIDLSKIGRGATHIYVHRG
jgi:hypothetical protein